MLSSTRACDAVVATLRDHADNPSAFLALNSGTEYFRADGIDGVVCHRTSGRYLVQLGGPFAADPVAMLTAFRDYAKQQRKHIVAVQLQAADARLYAEHGFTVNQMGSSYAIDLSSFTLRGSKFVKLRNKISRAKRCGLEVSECDPAEVAAELADIDREWLRSKGKFVKELDFLVGERTGDAAAYRRLFVGRIDGRVVAYISYSPVYGSRPGWLHDLTRRRADVPPGVMETLNATAIEAMTAEQAGWLHFGFTPFVGLEPSCEVDSAGPMVARIVRFLAEHGEHVYPSQTQLAYKEKWGPHAVLPEYIGFQGRPRLGAIWQLLRVTNSI